jgi:orotate phosphoribosyltransferase
MADAKAQLLQLIKERSFSMDGPFLLASGDTSDYYIDGKMTEVFSKGARLIGEVIYEVTRDLDFDAIGGLEVGAVPLTTAAVISYDLHGKALEGFWVRDAKKQHGTRKLVEGKLVEGSKVVVVDDVVTRGTSTVKAIRAVRELGCDVVRIVSLVDRLQGARELFEQEGITEYRPIFTVEDLGVKPKHARETVVSAAG